jgi:dolichol kinase
MVFEGIFVIWLMTDKKNLTPFAARKLCHAGSGCVMMLLNCQALASRLFIYCVAISSLIMNWELMPSVLPNFWFGVPRDKGITLYLILVATWVYLGLSLRILAPVFLADPAGAVVGKWMSSHFPKDNKKWIGDKTVIGSLAVFIATFISLYRPLEPLNRLAVSALAMLAEAIGGSFDNLMIALVVIAFSCVIDQ